MYLDSEPYSVTGLSLNDTCLKEGSMVSLQCEARGFPRPSVEFQLNGIPITPGIGTFQNFVQEFYNQVSIILCIYAKFALVVTVMVSLPDG